MTECTQECFNFPAVKRRKVEARFSGGDITSDGGLLLVHQVDQRLGLLQAVNAVLPDTRDSCCQPWRAKRRLVDPSRREAALLTRRAHSARGEAK